MAEERNGRNPSERYEAPEDWVGRPQRRRPPEQEAGGTADAAAGVEPQALRPDDHTPSAERPDERIREDVCDRLGEHGGIDATAIQVAVQDGEVTLDGMVGERAEKWLAEEVADGVPGVRDVLNHLGVRRRRA